jgi:hypothetical protein
MTDTVKVRWWHRLLLALVVLSGLLVAVIAIWVAYDASHETQYRYGWRGDKPGEYVMTCKAYIYETLGEASAHCGDFELPSEVLNDIVSAGRIRADNLPQPRNEIRDGYTLNSLSSALDLSYSHARVMVPALAWKAFGIAAGVIFGYLILAGFFVNLVLWIAHGTTRLQF